MRIFFLISLREENFIIINKVISGDNEVNTKRTNIARPLNNPRRKHEIIWNM